MIEAGVAIFIAVIAAIFAGVFGLLVGVAGGQLRWSGLGRNHGEALVANALAQLGSTHVLINNVTMSTGSGTTQIDHILVTGAGIFVIETKHYSGWIFGNPNDSQWTKVIYRKKSRFQNPLRQNYGHIKTVQSLFKLPESAFHGAVVFTGTAEFKTDPGPNVIRLNQLLAFIQQPRETVLDERQMTYVVGRIEMKRLRRSIETDEYHVNFVRQKLARV